MTRLFERWGMQMLSRWKTLGFLCLLGIAATCFFTDIILAQSPPSSIDNPYRKARLHPNQLPEREGGKLSEKRAPRPDQVKEVRLGYFGPGDADHPRAGDLWCAATLAIEEAKARGKHQGFSVRLLTAWSESPWEGGVADLARLIYHEDICAVIGGIDGPSTHLAEQLAAKARLPVVSPLATDKSIHLAGVPWIFSCSPGDHLLTQPLAEAIALAEAKGPMVLIEANDHDSHYFAVELLKKLHRHSIAPRHHLEFVSHTAADARHAAQHVLELEPGQIVVVADQTASRAIVEAIHSAGYQGPIFGSSTMNRGRFLEEVGEAAERVVFPLTTLAGTDQPPERWDPFAAAFEKRFGHPPEPRAAQAYDAMNIILRSIETAGTDRIGMARAIQAMKEYEGASGRICWDTTGANFRQVHLGTIREGRLIVVSSEKKFPSVTGGIPSR